MLTETYPTYSAFFTQIAIGRISPKIKMDRVATRPPIKPPAMLPKKMARALFTITFPNSRVTRSILSFFFRGMIFSA